VKPKGIDVRKAAKVERAHQIPLFLIFLLFFFFFSGWEKVAHKIGGCVLSKNAGERYGRTKYGAACQKCWMTNMGGTKCLPKMLDTDMGHTKLIVLLFFFLFFFDSAPCLSLFLSQLVETNQEGWKNVVWRTEEWW
jgi:hypothetical protein